MSAESAYQATPQYDADGRVIDPFGCDHDQATDWPHHTLSTDGSGQPVCAVDGLPWPCTQAEYPPVGQTDVSTDVPLLDVGGYLACGCHGEQREHTC